MKNEPKKSSGIPVIIIILVLVGIVVAGWFFYNQSKGVGNKNVSVANGNTSRPVTTPNPNAPQGATPPNMLGSPTAAVTLEEFADFQCGACATAHPIVKEIQSIYGSKIKMIFRNYPLPIHDKSYDAAVVAEAAGLQGKFWAMQDQLFTNQQAWSSPTANEKEMWSGYAEKIGLNMESFRNDVAGIAAKSRVDQDIARAKALGVSSTPTIYINGQSIPFPEVNVPGLRKLIDAELQKYPSQQQGSAPPATSSNAASPSNSSAANTNKK